MNKKQIEQREEAYSRCLGVCEVCGKPLYEGQMQFAHKIGNNEQQRKKYGSFFTDSSANGLYVCSLGCNHSVDISHNQGKVLETLVDILTYEINKFNGN